MCSNLFLKKGDQYLMIKRSESKKYLPGYLQSIGGKIEPNEDPYDAAVRELVEESGLTAKNIKLEAVITHCCTLAGSEHDWLVYYFSGEYDGGELIPCDEGELLWLRSEEFTEYKVLEPLRIILPNIFNPKDGTVFERVIHREDDNNIIDSKVKICSPNG
jgi:8-oxo-dGTP diphosphatase